MIIKVPPNVQISDTANVCTSWLAGRHANCLAGNNFFTILATTLSNTEYSLRVAGYCERWFSSHGSQKSDIGSLVLLWLYWTRPRDLFKVKWTFQYVASLTFSPAGVPAKERSSCTDWTDIDLRNKLPVSSGEKATLRVIDPCVIPPREYQKIGKCYFPSNFDFTLEAGFSIGGGSVQCTLQGLGINVFMELFRQQQPLPQSSSWKPAGVPSCKPSQGANT